ncbi:MAG: GNAT family N-acetyltransferase [Saprospiraceae bacterium]|nr:GNAT family N-acetyltransferase [Saprospiraceae bacterium]
MPEYRHRGIARILAEAQEAWLQGHGYRVVKMKTRNIHKRMIIFALNRGFSITAIESRTNLDQYRIHLMKNIDS